MRFPAKRSLFGRAKSEPFLAVDSIDLELRQGEIFGLVGPNGAGKTTLIKMLTTLLRPTEGHAIIDGHNVTSDPRFIQRSVGLVTSNERSFYWRLTGRQNLDFFASLYDLPQREVGAWIDELLELLNLQDKADDRFDGYSTGMKQRLAFARGLLCKPKFLFMDEPTKGVDPVSRADLDTILRERIIDRWHPTILITSHDLGEIERLCERVAVMHKGRILAQGTVDQLREEASAVNSYTVLVRGLDEARIRDLAAASGALGEVRLTPPDDGGDDLVARLEFGQRTTDFSRFVRGIVEARGEVIDCSTVHETFDQVFQRLVQRAGRAGA